MINVFKEMNIKELEQDLKQYGAIMPLNIKYQILAAIAAQEKRKQKKGLLSEIEKYVA